ncbi:MAG: ATP-binding cassette domain-containing protein [Muribaculaceae bacterium]|nr:ATP-binding cassette domain-containing protein [Muribaculaceae bacterium]
MKILEVDHIDKRFGNTHALRDVAFDVEAGSICGVLGPNGAGKTTLLRIINGIITCDTGRVLINGQPASLEMGCHIGYMPEERGLYDKMRVEDQILYFGRLKGGEPKRLREVMKTYMEMFNLTGQERRKVKELSKGNQQKVQIISTLVHEPELVILDEPFSGFDPINGAILQQVISKLHDSGTTVMLSSHNMPAIEEMCSDIALISHGNLLVKDSISSIKEAHRGDGLLITTRKPISLPMLTASGLIADAEETQTRDWRTGAAYRLRKNPGVRNNDLLDAVAAQGEIIHFEEELPTLKDIFIKLTSSESEAVTDTAVATENAENK